MPFEKSSVSPVVADLLKMRAYIATCGFCTDVSNTAGNRCLWGAARDLDLLYGKSQAWPLVKDVLFHRAGDLSAYPTIQAWLEGAGITTTERALEIIDAAIARA